MRSRKRKRETREVERGWEGDVGGAVRLGQACLTIVRGTVEAERGSVHGQRRSRRVSVRAKWGSTREGVPDTRGPDQR